MSIEEKDLNYWKKNAEEDYMKVPISVLRYIMELEKVVLSQLKESEKVLKIIPLSIWIRLKLQGCEEMHEYGIAIETLKVWIDEYSELLHSKDAEKDLKDLGVA